MPLIKPLGKEVKNILQGFQRIITLEEHVQEGGLFAALCEILAPTCHMNSIFISEEMKALVGSQDFLRIQSQFTKKLFIILAGSNNIENKNIIF